MRRVTGREAITLLAELATGKKKFNVSDERYLMRQSTSFRDWLMQNARLTKDDANKVLHELYQRDIRTIQNASEFADIGDPIKDSADDFRISPATMQRIETGVDPREHPEVPTRSRETYDRVMLVLANLEERLDGRELTPAERKHLWDVKLRVNHMRFGDPKELEYQHWAALFNRINGLLGIDKQAPEPPRPGSEGDDLSAAEEETIIRELEQELGPPPDEQPRG